MAQAGGCVEAYESGGCLGLAEWAWYAFLSCVCPDGEDDPPPTPVATITKIECTAPSDAANTNYTIGNVNRTGGAGNTRTLKAHVSSSGNVNNVGWTSTSNASVSSAKGETTIVTCSAGVSVITAKLDDSEKQVVLNCFEPLSSDWAGRIKNSTVLRKSPDSIGGNSSYSNTKTVDANFYVKNVRGYMTVNSVKWYLCDANDGSFTGYWVQESAIALTMPVKGASFRNPYDYPNYVRSGDFHGGTDMASPEGAPNGSTVVAVYGGTVYDINKSTTDGLGYCVRIYSVVNGVTYAFIYAHMQTSGFAPGLSVGSKVKGGQTLGKVGETGNADGPHLHLATRKSPYGHNSTDCVSPKSFY